MSADSPLWIIAMLTATGIAVGLVIRYSPGHAGPDPATESLIGAPIATGALPGLGRTDPRPRRRRQPRPGASDYGGEYRAGCRRRLPSVSARQLAGLDHPRGLRHHRCPLRYPVAAALIFRKPSIAATIRHCGIASLLPSSPPPPALTTGLFSIPIFAADPHYGQMRFVDILSGIIVALIAIAVGMVAVWCLPRLHALMHRLKNQS